MLRSVLTASLVLASTAALADSKTDCLTAKDHDLRIKGCSEILQHNPKDGVAYYNRADAYALKGDNDRAIADYTKAIDINPHNAPAYNGRGRAYTGKGDYVHAVADVTRAGELAAKPVPKLPTASAAVKATPRKSKEVTKPGAATPNPQALPPAGMAAGADKSKPSPKAGVTVSGTTPANENASDGSWPAWASKLKN